MSDLETLIDRAERAVAEIPLRTGGFDHLERTRSRRLRNRRIAAASTGIAIFAVVFFTASALLGDATRKAGVPGRTSPTPGPVRLWGMGFVRLPQQGEAPSAPAEGKLVARSQLPCLEVGSDACPGPDAIVGWVNVYADGRVISYLSGGSGLPKPRGYREQRLSAEGVELVRSGVFEPRDLILLCVRLERGPTGPCERRIGDVPSSAWEDASARMYVPSSYAICLGHGSPRLSTSQIFRLLPAKAKQLLRGTRQAFDHAGDDPVCFELPTDEARELDGRFTEAGYFWDTEGGVYVRQDLRLSLNPNGREAVYAEFLPVLPDGTLG